MRLLAILTSIFLITCTSASAQDWAKPRLNKSPRHLEWVTVKAGKRNVKCFVAYPESKTKATAVLVIHEIFGLSDWVRSITDQLAEEGYIAIAPDLLSETAPGGGGTEKYAGEDDVRKAVRELPPDQVTADLNAATDYVAKLPSCNGKVVVAGFCWGGAQAFRFAANNDKVKAAYVFYGQAPEESELGRIKAPVYGFYAENDERVNSTIASTQAAMKKLGKTFEPVTYKGGGHGFMRAGEAPDANSGNKDARPLAWKRWMNLLKKV
jgi:carboxymethylenebutenolidase